jgi:glycosyltransferase involved in cell wall biosynthesis
MRIVHVARRFDPAQWGGTEAVIVETSKRLVAAGHDCRILATAALSTPGRDLVAGIPVERFRYHYPMLGLSAAARRELDGAGGNLVSWALMRRILTMRPRPDVVHLHTAGRLGAMVQWACRRRGIPVVLHLHGGRYAIPAAQAERFAAPLRRTLDWGKPIGALFGSRRVAERADAVLAISRDEAEAARRALTGRQVQHLPNGVDVKSFRRLPAPGTPSPFGADAFPKLLCVARLDAQKGQLDLIAAVDSLKRKYPKVQVALVGPPSSESYAAAIARDVTARGLSQHVRVVGAVPAGSDALRRAYQDATLFVLPSHHEPFGLVVLEAFAAGLPVIATRVGGVPDLIHSAQLGRLVDAGDARALAGAVGELAGDDAARAGIANAAADDVERWDWSRGVARLVSLYERLIAARRTNSAPR